MGWSAVVVDFSFTVLSLEVQHFHFRVEAAFSFSEVLLLDPFSLELAGCQR
jgi:hypothetical protein